jgi:hypothetical protein
VPTYSRDHYRNKCNRLDEARRFALADRDRYKEELDKVIDKGMSTRKANRIKRLVAAVDHYQKEREKLAEERNRLILGVDVKLKALKEQHAEELKRKDEQIAHWQAKYKNKIYAND